MKFEEPKSKTGKPMLGVTVAYYANNRASSRWFLNGESAPVEKIANTLSYQTKQQFINATSKHGVALVLTKGLDKLRESNNGS